MFAASSSRSAQPFVVSNHKRAKTPRTQRPRLLRPVDTKKNFTMDRYQALVGEKAAADTRESSSSRTLLPWGAASYRQRKVGAIRAD